MNVSFARCVNGHYTAGAGLLLWACGGQIFPSQSAGWLVGWLVGSRSHVCGVVEDTKKGVGWSAAVACYSAAVSVACYSAAVSVAVSRRGAFLVVGIGNFVVGKTNVPIFHAIAANGSDQCSFVFALPRYNPNG